MAETKADDATIWSDNIPVDENIIDLETGFDVKEVASTVPKSDLRVP